MIVGFAGQAGSGKDTSADFLVKNHGFVKVAFADEIKRTCARIYPKMTREHLWGPSSMRNGPIMDYPRPHGPWIGIGGTHRCACCNVAQDLDDKFEPSHSSQCYLTARFALQQLGTEWGRTCYPSTWTDITMRVAGALLGRDGVTAHLYSPSEGLSMSASPLHGYINGYDAPRGIVISDLRWPDGNEGEAIRAAGGILVKLLRGSGLGGAKAAHESEAAVAGTPDSFYDEVIDNRDTSAGVFTLEQLDEQLGIMAKKYSDRRKA